MRVLKNFVATCFLAAAGLAAAAGASQAQVGGDLAGDWSCRHSMEPFNGVALDFHYWEYGISLMPDGTYGMQGFYYNRGLGVQVPVQGEGGWADIGQGRVEFRGQLFRADAGWSEYQLLLHIGDGSTLFLQFPGNTHMTVATCQR